jgi:Rrf2 family protein
VRLSAKGEYALRALLDLALVQGEGLVPIQDVAGRQRIPQRYLEQVLLALKRAGLAESRRGSAGGYRLGRAPGDITVGEVLRAVEGPAGTARGARQADDTGDLADLLARIDEAISGVVDRVTLLDLKRRAEERRSAARPMYHI